MLHDGCPHCIGSLGCEPVTEPVDAICHGWCNQCRHGCFDAPHTCLPPPGNSHAPRYLPTIAIAIAIATATSHTLTAPVYLYPLSTAPLQCCKSEDEGLQEEGVMALGTLASGIRAAVMRYD